jgi:hypothetical protein
MAVWPRTIAVLALAPLLAAAVFLFVERVDRRRELIEGPGLEAAYATQELAARLVVCSDRTRFDAPGESPRTLPPTSKKVPTALPRGVWVPTTASDWDDAAYRCADFRLLEPQPFQLQWVLNEKPKSDWATSQGVVRAEADLDGDGKVDHVVETEVACAKDQCMVAPRATVRVLR